MCSCSCRTTVFSYVFFCKTRRHMLNSRIGKHQIQQFTRIQQGNSIHHNTKVITHTLGQRTTKQEWSQNYNFYPKSVDLQHRENTPKNCTNHLQPKSSTHSLLNQGTQPITWSNQLKPVASRPSHSEHQKPKPHCQHICNDPPFTKGRK
jgi:hypothetical protein